MEHHDICKNSSLSFSLKQKGKGEEKNNVLDDHLTQINVHVSHGPAVQIECLSEISATFIQ